MVNLFERGPEKDPKLIDCPKCSGLGKVKDQKGNPKTCDRCGGKGWILVQRY